MDNYADQVVQEHFNFTNMQKNPKHLESKVFPGTGVSTGMSSVLAVIWDRLLTQPTGLQCPAWHRALHSCGSQKNPAVPQATWLPCHMHRLSSRQPPASMEIRSPRCPRDAPRDTQGYLVPAKLFCPSKEPRSQDVLGAIREAEMKAFLMWGNLQSTNPDPVHPLLPSALQVQKAPSAQLAWDFPLLSFQCDCWQKQCRNALKCSPNGRRALTKLPLQGLSCSFSTYKRLTGMWQNCHVSTGRQFRTGAGLHTIFSSLKCRYCSRLEKQVAFPLRI